MKILIIENIYKYFSPVSEMSTNTGSLIIYKGKKKRQIIYQRLLAKCFPGIIAFRFRNKDEMLQNKLKVYRIN